MVDEIQPKGNYSRIVNAADLAKGIYTARLIVKTASNETIRTIKLINIK